MVRYFSSAGGVVAAAADHELARGIDVHDVVVADQTGQLVAGTLQARLDARDDWKSAIHLR